MSDKFYQRAKVVFCSQLGCPLWEFDEAVEEQKISLEDVFEVLMLYRSTPILGENLQDYLFREEALVKKNASDAIQTLGWFKDKAKTPEEKARFDEAISKIRKNPKSVKLKR